MALQLLLRGVYAASILAVASAGLAVERATVDHAYVTELARDLAQAPDRAEAQAVPRYFRELSYDHYRRITFNEDRTLWRDLGTPFQIQFFHPGYLFNRRVQLHEFTSTHTQPIAFSTAFFDYHDLSLPLLSRWGLDFAGFRALYPLNRPDKWDEVISFLGASYFRALARGQFYGASARGLAINAGLPEPEEFPAFTEFWLGKPEPAAGVLVVHALLESASVTGAYTFTITPGDETIVETKATLFFRRGVTATGFAPLSSMFWFGEGSVRRFGDFRPEVHDSDGLLIAPTPETRLWRPLLNPTAVTVTEFAAPALAGFGLLQRDRAYVSYVDLEARYEHRPGIWIEPIGPWPAGRVRLVEIPAQDEYHDNVTAYWTPDQPIAPGQPFELAWRQRWSNHAHFGGPSGWVGATRQSLHDGALDRTKYVIDFDPASLASLPENTALTADVTITGAAQLTGSQVIRNEVDGSYRLVLRLQAAPGSPASDIRARLLHEQTPVTETWTTRWQP